MNEHIDFLVDKTANLMPGVCNIEYESGKKGVEFTEDALEKFVEMIVHDCVEICENLETEYLTLRKNEMDFSEKNIWAQGETAALAIKRTIKRQFGVTE
jgi:hypothetical protein